MAVSSQPTAAPSPVPRRRARAAPTTTPQREQAKAEAPLTVKRVLMLQGLGLLAALLVGGVVFYIWHQSYYFYSTNDSMVSGTTANASASVSGTVATLDHQVGDAVNAGDTIATITASSGSTKKVTSPIAGTIYNEMATQGQYVSAGQTLAQVTVLGTLYITAYVDEGKVRQIHIGQGADVTVDNANMHGNVQLIVPVTAGETSPLPTTDYASGNFTEVDQRVPVHIRLNGADGHTIYPGESADVTIHLHDSGP